MQTGIFGRRRVEPEQSYQWHRPNSQVSIAVYDQRPVDSRRPDVVHVIGFDRIEHTCIDQNTSQSNIYNA